MARIIGMVLDKSRVRSKDFSLVTEIVPGIVLVLLPLYLWCTTRERSGEQ